MPKIIPTINSCSGKITAGEKRLARILENNLSSEALCWYDIAIGERNLYPDFIILEPKIGLIFLEVKDWFSSRIRSFDKDKLEYENDEGIICLKNPFEQVRNYANTAINWLRKDAGLQQRDGKYTGSFCFPYGYGVYLSNITRKQYNKLFESDASKNILPANHVICKDEITEFMSAEKIQQQINKLVGYKVDFEATIEKINRIRWNLYPEIRIQGKNKKYDEAENTEHDTVQSPGIIKIMDTQQELLARSLGEGHRVIHGVAGSGKTLILLYRCYHLAKTSTSEKPILVTCFNITLARKLSSIIKTTIPQANIEVIHFHSWCARKVKEYQLPCQKEGNHVKNLELAVINGFQNASLPAGKYSAVLIDEGHDFESEWLSLLAKMVDPSTQSLLFLYDDVQSIYKKRNSLGFSLASVGIQALGRTSILKLNYRNTQQILHFASLVAFNYLNEHCTNGVKYDKPEAAGDMGTYPVVIKCLSKHDEKNRIAEWLTGERKKVIDWCDMAILCPTTLIFSDETFKFLKDRAIPFNLIRTPEDKRKYNPNENKVVIMPLPSSKGLEFHSVAIFDTCNMLGKDNDLSDNIRKLYVGFTRATHHLLVTLTRENALSDHIHSIYLGLNRN